MCEYEHASIGTSPCGFLRKCQAAGKTPFYIQKMQLEMWKSTQLSCQGRLPDEGPVVGGGGLFEGFYFRAFVQLFCAVAQGWLGGIIVKRFSTVVKNIAKSLSLILTVFSNEIFFWECHDEPLSSTMYLLSVSIFCSTVVFSQLGEDGAKPQAPAVPLPAVSASEHQSSGSGAAAAVELGPAEERQPLVSPGAGFARLLSPGAGFARAFPGQLEAANVTLETLQAAYGAAIAAAKERFQA
ncbi:unnamed protein product [Prorocentrum cordatum]|uniref:Uncharacterized protein n=1 Tax=Prorocentrum cordatum TaxID=2364126 RepID=A0ABN9XFF5_9DINO|nr:unnamed protein product [Polarella glacialis]